MKYRVKDRTTITREDGTLLGAGNLLENPTALEIASNRECLEVVLEIGPTPELGRAPETTAARQRKKKKPKES